MKIAYIEPRKNHNYTVQSHSKNILNLFHQWCIKMEGLKLFHYTSIN